ncbi:hypothetical protein GEMRC1_004292 [Eukaryota sp. GEM-RC1]
MTSWEDSKENMAPLRTGRNPVLTDSQDSFEHFEAEISSTSLDDPLEPWLRYINWVKNTHSDRPDILTQLLERVTNQLQHLQMYSNDKRYIMLWIQYADQCPDPVDIFAYMYSNEIGLDLALYWEAYALVCEQKSQHSKVHSVYQEGIKRKAHPVARLSKKYSEYQIRHPEPIKSRSIPLGRDQSAPPSQSIVTSSFGADFEVFQDDEEDTGSAAFPKPYWRELASIETRTRENINVKQKWSEVGPLPQKRISKKVQKFQIYSDDQVSKPSKKSKSTTEVLSFDISNLYSAEGEEFCFEELRSKCPRYFIVEPEEEEEVPMEEENHYVSDLESVTSLMSGSDYHVSSPTVNTKVAMSDVLKMFSSPIISKKTEKKSSLFNSDFEPPILDSKTNSNFEIFEEHTVNFEPPKLDRSQSNSNQNIVVDEENSLVVGVNYPKEIEFQVMKAQNYLINRPDYDDLSDRLPRISIDNDYDLGDRSIMVRSILGSGVFATVYDVIVENFTSDSPSEWEQDSVVAMKAGKELSPLEFYIMVVLSSRLEPCTCPKILAPLHFTKFSNGGVLFSEQHVQGTLQGVVNKLRTKGEALDETLILYFASEMMHVLSKVQEVGVIHGDLKPDNWLMALNSEDLTCAEFTTERDNNWDSFGLVLADFGSSIDTTMYPKNTFFKGTICASCFANPRVSEGCEWKYDVDWFALAGCIYVMLFGEYMEVVERDGQYVIKKPFKRYWQKLCGQLFFKIY